MLRLSGGGYGPNPRELLGLPEKVEELTIAPGGSIHQTVVSDPLPADDWDLESSVMFNVQLLDASTFKALGIQVPPSPVTARTYAKFGYPFFEMDEEPSGIFGDFSIQTVCELDNANGTNSQIREAEKNLHFRTVPIGKWSGLFPAKGEIKLNAVDEKSLFLPFRPAKKGSGQ